MDLNKLSEALKELSTSQQYITEIKALEEKLAFYDNFRKLIKDQFVNALKNLSKEDKDQFIELILTTLVDDQKQYGKYPSKILFINSGWLPPNCQKTIEMLAGRAGAFKPHSIKMFSLDKNGKKVNIDICNVNVMGTPQLVNYIGSTYERHRGSTLFFDDFQHVDWQVFGASTGQGLQIEIKNNNLDDVNLYIMVYGDPATSDLIGRA